MTHGFRPRGHLRRLCRRWRRVAGTTWRRRRASAAGFDEAGSPRPQLGRGDVGELDGAERRKDVQSKQAAVDLPGARAQVRTVGESPAGVVGEWDFAAFRVDPRCPLEVRPRGGEPAVGDALRAERFRRHSPPTLDLVARLPAPRRQSAGVPRGRRSTQRAWLERCGTTGRSRSRPTTCERSETII